MVFLVHFDSIFQVYSLKGSNFDTLSQVFFHSVRLCLISQVFFQFERFLTQIFKYAPCSMCLRLKSIFKLCSLFGVFLTQSPHMFLTQPPSNPLCTQLPKNILIKSVFGLFSQTNSCGSVHPHNMRFVLVHTPKTVYVVRIGSSQHPLFRFQFIPPNIIFLFHKNPSLSWKM